MPYRAVTCCRICKSESLHSVLDLGTQALTGVFPKSPEEEIPAGPLELVKCLEGQGGCGLVQLRHTYPPECMYGENYGYRSGLNQSMVHHLGRRVRRALDLARPLQGDAVLDIGSNDSTLLRSYPANLKRFGMDPTGNKFADFYPPEIRLIPDFFSAAAFLKATGGRKAKIITSIAMFYDLEDPLAFMQEVAESLADDGIWVFEQNYLPNMLRVCGYDNVCHEHISYYSLRQIKWMTDRLGLKIVGLELNEVNGCSLCVTVAKCSAPFQEERREVEQLLSQEDVAGLGTLQPFQEFRERVNQHRKEFRDLLASLRQEGRSVYGYGASTKGNVLLQFCGLSANDIPAIAEVNEDKFGRCTPGTRIPIWSETQVHRCKPDYLLVLPWHFRAGIIQRESAYLARGGKLLFPLPHLEVFELSRQAGAA